MSTGTIVDNLEETWSMQDHERCCERNSIDCSEPADIMVLWERCCGSKTRYHYCFPCFDAYLDPDNVRRASCEDCDATVEVLFARNLK